MREEWKLAKERQLERATGGGGGEGGEGKEEGGDETLGEVHTLHTLSVLSSYHLSPPLTNTNVRS